MLCQLPLCPRLSDQKWYKEHCIVDSETKTLVSLQEAVV